MSDAGGYGKPPFSKRWQKGQSGNPRGRTKGSTNLKTDVAAELREIVHIREGGQDKAISKQRALIKSIIAHSIKGNGAATGHALRLAALVEQDSDFMPNISSVEDQKLIANFLSRNKDKKSQP